jgi:serine/threonine protein kinase
MQPERVERVKFLLATALAKPVGEREAYLDVACAGDWDLRRDVEQYLNSGDKTEQFVYHADRAETVEQAVTPTADPRIGKSFGKYIIRKRVAEGGMGIVYLALDTQLGREVALKILPEYFSMDKERLHRFHREARATSLLNHPNIVTVFELGQMEGCEFIVTEFVEGETLREKMRRGSVPFVEMLKIGTQVAGALSAAHKAGIVHRDIKPENIMIRPDGYVKVLDFGLAKLSDAMGKAVSGNIDISQHNRTVPGMIMGTVAYMSPEQTEGTEVDARTDIWALGVILYEMAAGKLPFEGPTMSHMIVAILEHEPQPYEHPSMELRQIISTALQKDKQLRFQTADAMGDALEGLKHRLGYISDQKVVPPTPEERKVAAVAVSEKPPKQSRGWAWLIPVALVILMVGGFGITGVALLISRNWSSANENKAVNSPTPTPTSTVEVTTPTPEPTAPVVVSTPVPVYVEPTPEPTAVSTSTPRNPIPRPTVQTIHTPEPRPTPNRTPRPRPTQNPNCVFTNSCH